MSDANNGSRTLENQTNVVKTKVVKLDNLVEKLQSKLNITSFEYPVVRRILTSLLTHSNTYYRHKPGFVQQTLPAIYAYIAREKDSSGDVNKDRKFMGEIPLFQIKQVYTQDDFYIFESATGIFFHANIQEFDEKGVMAESLQDGKPSLDTEGNLIRGFTINNTTTSIQLLKDSKVVSTLIGDLIVVVDKKAGDVVVTHENLIEYINIDAHGKHQTTSGPFNHPYGTIEKLRIDRNSNFLLLISKYDDGKQKLHVVNRKTLEVVESFDDIVDIIQIDNKDDLTCLDKDGKLVNIDTNFDQFPIGFVEGGTIGKRKVIEIENRAHAQLEAALSGGGLQIDIAGLTNGEKRNGNENNKHTEFISKLWETKVGDKMLRELFDEAQGDEEIDLVYNALLQIKSDPLVSAVAGITDSMESAIHDKRFQLQLQSLKENLQTIEDMFEQARENSETEPYKYFPALVSLQRELQNLKKTRSGLPLIDESIDKTISEMGSLLETEILEFRLKNVAEIIQVVDANLEKIGSFLTAVSFLTQITQIYSTDLYRETEGLITYLEDSEKTLYKEKLNTLISQRIAEIQAQEKLVKDKEMEGTKKQIAEIEKGMQELGKIIETVEDEQNLEVMRKSDSLIMRIRHDLESLPKSEAEKLSLALDGLFIERKQRIRIQKLDQKGVIYSLDEYGIDTSLYYSDRSKKQVSSKVVGHKTASGNIKLEIHYDDGTIFNLEKYLQDSEKYAHTLAFDDIKTEMSQQEFIALQRNIAEWQKSGKKRLQKLRSSLEGKDTAEKQIIAKQIMDLNQTYTKARSVELFTSTLANKLNLNPRSRLELPNPKFIVLDEEREILSKMSHGFDIQRQEQKGIDILEGPPGLGKTEICKFFAANTNREIIRVQCSKMDPSDLFFSPQLKAGETMRQPAEWIRYMQRPGTIILFDEIDKLNPQSFERLHSLFDGARSVYDPQLGWVKTNPDCLFVGTRNSYEKMSNPIVSRATIIEIKAPSELNEAFKIAKGYTGIEFFENLDFDAFKKLWTERQESTDIHAKKMYEILRYIQALISVFIELRQKQTSDSYDEKFVYELSYRDAEQIFLRYNRSSNTSFVEKAIEVLVPKARAVVYENNEKDIQEKIVRDAVKEFMS